MVNTTHLPKRQNPLYQAQAILSRRDHSVAEVKLKLTRKRFSPSQIAEAIAWLQEHNLLDDHRFARTYTESLLKSKPVGPRWITKKLRQKGIEAPVIHDIIQNIVEPQEEALLQKAVTRWRRQHPEQSDDKQRLMRFLISRGFSLRILP